MNPYLLLGLALLWGASIAGSGTWFYGAGKNAVIAEQKKVEDIVAAAQAAFEESNVELISKLRPQYVTIKGAIEREVRTQLVYRDCVHSPDGLRALNQAITGDIDADGARHVSRQPDTLGGRDVRGDDTTLHRADHRASAVPPGAGDQR